jgi:predicted alternative tryptophan synthase beta-subunit
MEEDSHGMFGHPNMKKALEGYKDDPWSRPIKTLDPSEKQALPEGTKYDEGKLRYDLLPADALRELVSVYTMGAKKYEDRNWEKGILYHRVFSALMRHVWAWWEGERNAQDDGQHHLASVAWCALALLHFDLNKRYEIFDDRVK